MFISTLCRRPPQRRWDSSSAFPSYISGIHLFGEILANVAFLNPTIEVVTFRLCGWCMLGVFLLPAFTHLGHECQDLLSPCNAMHVCTDYTSVYTLIRKSFWGMELEPTLTPRGKKTLYQKKFSSEEDRNSDAASSRAESPTHYQRAITDTPSPPPSY